MSLRLKGAVTALVLAGTPPTSLGAVEGMPGESAAIPAGMGMLVVQANTDCDLKINGDPQGRLAGKTPQTFPMKPGRAFVECSASDESSDRAIESIKLGEPTEVKLRMPPPGRFSERAEGRHDAELGVVWTMSVNEADIDWPGAKRHCESKGPGWSLPTVAQLQSLYEAGMTPAFTFRDDGISSLWSSDTRTQESAYTVALWSGLRTSVAPTFSKKMRAFCVRRA